MKPMGERSNPVVDEILAERLRQLEAEGWDTAHDDEHTDGSMACAAAAYALPEAYRSYRTQTDVRDFEDRSAGHEDLREVHSTVPRIWPHSWASWWWKPKDRRCDLVRAAALIVAEIERIDREKEKPEACQHIWRQLDTHPGAVCTKCGMAD